MQMFLSHDLYRDNLLKTGNLKIMGVPIDLKNVTTPIYMISMFKDHLVPWKAAFDGLKLFKTPVRFVVGGSGHVAGAINHPDSSSSSKIERYCARVDRYGNRICRFLVE